MSALDIIRFDFCNAELVYRWMKSQATNSVVLSCALSSSGVIWQTKERTVLGQGAGVARIVEVADNRREGIAFPVHRLQHRGKLLLHDQHSLISNTVIGISEKTDKALA